MPVGYESGKYVALGANTLIEHYKSLQILQFVMYGIPQESSKL